MLMGMTASIKAAGRKEKEKICIAMFSPNGMQRRSGCVAAWHDDSHQIDRRMESPQALYPISQAHHRPCVATV